MALFGTLVGRCVRLILQRPKSPEERIAALTMTGLHAGFVLTALGAQLSLGYPYSILGVFGLGLVIHELLPRDRWLGLDVPAVAVLLIAFLYNLRLNDELPYRDMARPLPMDLGAVFPKLAGIKAGRPNFHRYQALKQLLDEHASGRPFAVLSGLSRRALADQHAQSHRHRLGVSTRARRLRGSPHSRARGLRADRGRSKGEGRRLDD